MESNFIGGVDLHVDNTITLDHDLTGWDFAQAEDSARLEAQALAIQQSNQTGQL